MELPHVFSEIHFEQFLILTRSFSQKAFSVWRTARFLAELKLICMEIKCGIDVCMEMGKTISLISYINWVVADILISAVHCREQILNNCCL